MKKMLVTGVLAMGTALSASAAIGIDWSASGGFYENGTTGANDPGDWIGNDFGSATAQLMWSVDMVADELLVENSDIVLRTLSPASVYGDFSAGLPVVFNDGDYGVTLAGGYFYARIFQSAAPIAGEYWFRTEPVLAALYDPNSPVLQTLDMNANPSDPTFGANELNRQIVPEPSVLAFLGLGGLAMAFRRVRK